MVTITIFFSQFPINSKVHCGYCVPSMLKHLDTKANTAQNIFCYAFKATYLMYCVYFNDGLLITNQQWTMLLAPPLKCH